MIIARKDGFDYYRKKITAVRMILVIENMANGKYTNGWKDISFRPYSFIRAAW